MQWEGISIVTGAIENLFTVDRRVGWSEVGTNFGIHGWSQDTTDNETLDNRLSCVEMGGEILLYVGKKW